MQKEPSENTVRIKGTPQLSEAQREQLQKLAAMPDDTIDYSDIPEIADLSGFEVGKFYRPVKETVTIRLDSDVLRWLKQGGKGYQSRLNALLRKEMKTNSSQRKAA